jgi:hypothetical protein
MHTQPRNEEDGGEGDIGSGEEVFLGVRRRLVEKLAILINIS